MDPGSLDRLIGRLEPSESRPERFILFCDDLSYEANEPGYKALKAILDGSVSAAPDNVLLYPTSNRRHLMPEYMRDNLDAHYVRAEVHPSEAVEEKISLSGRFGLWLSFHSFNQEDYVTIVHHWVGALDGTGNPGTDGMEGGAEEWEQVRARALKRALSRGSRSGRSACQFARDRVGRRQLGETG